MSERTTPNPEPRERPNDAAQTAARDVLSTSNYARNTDHYFGEDMVKQYLERIAKEPMLDAEEEVELARQIEAGLAADRIQLLRTTPEPGALYSGLKPEDQPRYEATDAMLIEQSKTITEEELADLSQLGAQAKDRYIQANLRLVVSVAKRYPDLPGMQLLDRIQEGNLGLIKAVEKFNYSKGFKFSTYATWWIRQSMSLAMAEKSRTIRLPTQVHDEVSRVVRTRRQLTLAAQAEVSVNDIAIQLDKSPEEVQKLMRLDRGPISLSTPLDVTENRAELGDIITDTDQEDTDKRIAIEDFMGVVAAKLEKTMGDEGTLCLRIMRRYYGLDGAAKLPAFPVVAAELGIGHVKAKRILDAGRGILRYHLRDSGYQDLFD